MSLLIKFLEVYIFENFKFEINSIFLILYKLINFDLTDLKKNLTLKFVEKNYI
jgi:hypothetical protein